MTPAWFVLDGADPAALPLGAQCRVVYAPVDVPTTESQRGWCVVTFTVVEAQNLHPPYDRQRMLRDDGWRRLTAEEAAGLWAGLGL